MDPRSRPAEPQDYKQKMHRTCVHRSEQQVGLRRAARLQSSCTGVHSRTRHRSAMALTMYYADHRSDGD